MTDRECSFAVLLALFDLSRAGLPSSLERVAGRLDLSARLVDAALDRLARAGLVSAGVPGAPGRHNCVASASRTTPADARLTLQGLALASSLDGTRASLCTPHARLAA